MSPNIKAIESFSCPAPFPPLGRCARNFFFWPGQRTLNPDLHLYLSRQARQKNCGGKRHCQTNREDTCHKRCPAGIFRPCPSKNGKPEYGPYEFHSPTPFRG